MDDNHYLVTRHKDGVINDLEHKVTAQDNEDAEDWFVVVKDYLLDVNHWDKYADNANTLFRLTDSHGKPVSRGAHRGDHIVMMNRGAGSVRSEDMNMAIIEAIEYDDYPDLDKETFAIRLLPVANQGSATGGESTGFFNYDASSTLVVERTGIELAVLYHGRNETIHTNDTHNNGWLGLTEDDWAGLVKGLLTE